MSNAMKWTCIILGFILLLAAIFFGYGYATIRSLENIEAPNTQDESEVEHGSSQGSSKAGSPRPYHALSALLAMAS